jgi:hypothetical protein
MRLRLPILLLVPMLGLAACATLTESKEQTVLVQTVLENREVPGAGCVLYNDVGKWFVTTPGHVSIRKSAAPLRVDCRKDGVAWTYDKVDSKLNGSLWGDVAFTAGIGYLVDRNTGAGFDYPATLTIVLRPDPAEAPRTAPSGTTLY